MGAMLSLGYCRRAQSVVALCTEGGAVVQLQIEFRDLAPLHLLLMEGARD